MSLAAIYQELHRRARDTGEDRAQTLKGGARLAVRVQCDDRGDVVTLTISRPKKQLGTTELGTFQRDCGVPETAARFPQEGQNTRTVGGILWWYVAYRWREELTDD